MALSITSLTNLDTGTTVQATLDGAPNGALTFYAARIPDTRYAKPLTVVAQAGNVYTLQVAHAALWYIWAADTNGFTPVGAAVWASTADGFDTDLIAGHIRDILLDNQAGIEAAMRIADPNATLKQVIYGWGANIVEWPAIVIEEPTVTDQYVFAPYGSEQIHSYKIGFILVHQTEESQLANVSRIGRAIAAILNIAYYESFRLADGRTVTHCRAHLGRSTERAIPGGSFAAMCALEWSGRTLMMDAEAASGL